MNTKIFLSSLMLAISLAACGGGGSDSGTTTPSSGDSGSGGGGSGSGTTTPPSEDSGSGGGGSSGPSSFTLNISVTGNGTISDDQTATSWNCVSAGSKSCTASYTAGTSVILSPTPAQGYTFASWGGDCAGAPPAHAQFSPSGPIQVTMNANLNCSAQFSAVPVSLSGPVQPEVLGNKLIDARTGKVWTPHGANLPRLEYACVSVPGYVPSLPDDSLSMAASWGIDTVRIPLNENCWLGTNNAPSSGSGTAAQYQSQVAQWVNTAHAAGMVVILDLHWSAPSGTVSPGDDPPWEQFPMADNQSVQFWSQVAAAYQDDPSVMFDLFNEPYGFNSWACWRDGGCTASNAQQGATPTTTINVVGMAALVNAVRTAGAKQPILLAGLNYANDFSSWLTYKPGDSQLAASWHNYLGQGCSDVNCWNSQIAPVAAQVPVVMTEFGYENSDTGYFGTAMAWADSAGIGYLPWAWWDQSDTGGFAGDNRFPPNCTQGSPDCYDVYALYTGSNYGLTDEGTAYQAHLAALPH